MAIHLLWSILFSGLLMASGESKGAQKTYYEDRERGWFWYEKIIVKEIKEDETPEETPVLAPALPVLSPTEQLRKQGIDVENALSTAILNPSLENNVFFLQKMSALQNQSQRFAKGVQQTLWVSPEYDSRLKNPVATQAIFARNQEKMENNESVLFELAQTHGLVFFFRSDCPYCHRFAPILQRFSEQFGFDVTAISLDGKGLPEYPSPNVNQKMAEKLKVKVVPAMFLVNPKDRAVATVGYGYASWSVLMDKVLFAYDQLKGESLVKKVGKW
jgi:conjugal transfer pilus assembly protein TraF